MEAFSLLKYWRGGGGGGGAHGADAISLRASAASVRTGAAGSTTIVTAVSDQVVDADEEEEEDGPFFDLEFTVPDEDEQEDGDGEGEEGDVKSSGNVENGEEGDVKSRGNVEEGEEEEDDDVESTGSEGEREFKFTLASSGSSTDQTDPNLSLSPSDDLFFKGRLVSLEPSSLAFNSSEANVKANQFPVSFLKSATKFRVFMLGLKKSKSSTVEKTESGGSASAAQKQQKQESHVQPQPQPQKQQESKFFTVKFKVEEVPIVSLLSRDNSSRSSPGTTKAQKQSSDETASDEKRFSKDVMQKYLKMVKPLYVRVSRRYSDKLKFSGQFSLGSGIKLGTATDPATNLKSSTTKLKTELDQEVTETPMINAKGQKQGNIPAGLRVVCKHLGKSRSASSAVSAVPSAPSQTRRRDDSLLQQQDGIQSAILHCKRSFNASRDLESFVLSRSVSDPSHEKSLDMSRNSSKQLEDVSA